MTNSKKRLFAVLAVAIVLCISTMILAACGTDSVVKFMVQNDNGEWQELSSQTVGKKDTVNAPTAPAKDYYEFANWYTDENFTTLFDSSAVKGNMNVYAKYNPVEVTVHINNDKPVTKNLADVVNKTYNPGNGLDFDGWYKDTNCTVKWDGKEVVQDLYAKSVATIRFTNGWAADDFTTTVNPGEKLDLQEEVVLEDQTTTTFELANIVKSYMSKYDLEYVDENGAVVDFSQPITKNMKVTVLWNSKGISKDHFKELPLNNGFYMYRIQGIAGIDIKDAPILSIRNKVTFESNKDGNISTETLNLESIKFVQKCLPDTVKKIIIGDGIKAVQGMNGQAASAVEDIVLPSSLKIIDTSFNNMPNLKGVTLPNGLEVLIDSFFIEAGVGPTNDQGLGKANPNFEIAVPDSVINIAMMPNNLKFSKTEATAEVGDFYKGEDGKIYLNHKDGKVLVSDPAAVEDNFIQGSYIRAKAGVIIVPEGVVGIQVGTYETYFERLVLPSSFKFVNYNADLTKYEKFYDIYTNGTTEGANVLMIPSQYDQYFTNENSLQPSFSNDSNIDYRGITVTTKVGGYPSQGAGIVEVPFTKEECATANINFGFVQASYSDAVTLPNLDNYINFKDSVNSVFVTVSFMNNEYENQVVAKLSDVKNISYAAVKEALIASNSDIKGTLDTNNIELFNVETKVEDGAAVTNDMYLTVNLIKINALNINSNFKIKGRPGPPPWDYSDPANSPVERTGNCTAKMLDITGLSEEKLKTIIIDAAAKVLLNNPIYGMPNDETIIKNNLKYFYDRATKVEFKVNGQVVDLSSINIDNGDVTLDVVWTFA